VECLLRCGNRQLPHHLAQGFSGSDLNRVYMTGGKRQSMHAMLGEVRPGQPLIIAEGFATAATMRGVTGLAVAVAFDSGNLVEVARAYRERDPALPIVIAADNDHHLP